MTLPKKATPEETPYGLWHMSRLVMRPWTSPRQRTLSKTYLNVLRKWLIYFSFNDPFNRRLSACVAWEWQPSWIFLYFHPPNTEFLYLPFWKFFATIRKKDFKLCCISFRLLTLKLSGLYCSSMFTTVVQWLPLSDPSNKYQTTTLSGMACTGSEFKLPNLTHYSFSHKTHTVDISTLFCYLTYLNG